MKKFLEEFINYIPFVIMSTSDPQCEKSPRFNVARLLETVIIGILGGIIASFLTIQELKIKLEYTEKKIEKIEKRIEQIEERLFWKNK